jgi:putative zinc finger protein
VNCLHAREQLTEHALGVLPSDDAAALERHLEWCAACRKEAGELQRATVTLAYTVAPAEPPADLEERVVDAVKAAAGRKAAAPRRSRVVAAGVLAAMLALSGLGFGAVMAGRAERRQQQVENIQRRQKEAIRRLSQVFQLQEVAPDSVVELSTLLSPRLRPGRGDALVLLSPEGDDLVFVLVDGLSKIRPGQLPLNVSLAHDGAQLAVGQIRTLDDGGGGGVYRTFRQDLSDVDAIVIHDANGKVVLHGTLSVYAPAS